MLQRLRGLSLRRTGAPSLLIALTASLLVTLPSQMAVAVTTAQDDSLVASPLPTYGPGRLKNATPMTQGCVVTRSRVIKHLKKGANCASGSRKVEFKVNLPTQLCLMPKGALKTYQNRTLCRERNGIHLRGLGNNKMLFCAVPGQAVRWVGKRKKCVRRERAFTLRNHRPVSLTLGGSTLSENAGPNALVGTFNTVDVDPGDVERYSLVSGAGSTDNALFRVSGGQLFAHDGLDHESGNTRRVRVRVRDFRKGRLTRSFTIQINDVNESPTGLALSGDRVVENAAPGIEVGILSAADVDADDVQSYTLVGSGNDNADFEILGDRLVTAASLDHEAGATRTIRVRVTDAGGLSQEREFTVDVTDVNELPTALTLSRDVVAENAPAQTLVGTFAVADIDAGEPYSFEIVAGVDDADLFAVSGDELRTTRPLDHEAAATRSVRVRVTDVDGLTYTDTLRIRVVDLNEAPTALRVDGDEVAENAPAGTAVSVLTGADPDRGDVLTYSLATGADDADNHLFQIVGDRLLTTGPLDHESSTTRSIRLKVADAAGLAHERVLTVSVLDINEAPSGLRLSRDTIDENVAVGSVVGTLAADDQDSGDVLSFALTAGDGDTDNDHFDVVGTQLRTARGLDHEVAATRTVRLRVTDAAGAQQSRSFTITVRDLNEGPRDLTLDHDEVEENSVAGTLVGTLSAADEDDAETLTFSLVVGAGDVDNGLFEIAGNRLLTRRPLDHEAASTRSVRVRVTDVAGEQYTRVFTLTVRDVNEGPQTPILGDDRIRENAPSGTVVGRLSSSDPDVGDTVSFTLATGSGDSHNGDFEIVGDELRTTRAFDFETEQTRSVRIRASDGALTASAVFVVRVIDVDEAPTGLALDHDEIDENVVGRVGTLTATDAEGNALTYSLVTGSGDMDNSHFEIVGDDLRTITGLDFEAGQSRSVRIQVTDGTTPVSRVFTITVLDVNEAPGALSLSARGVDENVARAVVGTVSADDPDAGSTLTYSLEAGVGDADNAEFEMDGTTLRTRAALDFEAGATRSVRIVATDGTDTVAGIFTIIVRDRNDAPTEIVLDRTDILDSATDDAVVGTLSATDQDADRPHAFTVVAGGDHGGLFTVVDDELRVTGSLVGVAGPKTVKVRVTDTWGGMTHTHHELLSVTVTADTALTLTLDQDTAEENSAEGTRVGAFQTLGAGVAPFTYALVSGAVDNSDFSISSGALVTTRAFDHESTPTRTVRVLVTDADGLRWVRDVTVQVTDVNEPPKAVDDSSSFLEGKPGYYSLDGWDPEGAPLTWSFATCTQGGDDNDRFTVNPTTGVFSYRGLVDFEEWAPTGIIRLCMGVSDGVNLTTVYRTPTVYDENEPTTDITLDSHSVDVAAPVGTVVGTLTAVDPDSRKPVLSDISVAGIHSGAGYFTIVGSQLMVARDLNALPLGDVKIKVEAADSWPGSVIAQSFSKVLTVSVQRPLTLAAPDATVAENAPIGRAVSTLTATGGEAPYTYTLDGSGDDNTLFEMVGNTLRTNAALDFESKAGLTAKVKVTDHAGAVVRRVVTVTVTDVNEAPTAITVTGTLSENAPAGTTARTLTAVDPDAGDSHTYTLVTGSGADDNTDFEIVGDRLVTKRPFDHEAAASRSVRIRASDSSGGSYERAVTIAVTDLPEAPTAVILSNATVDEGLPGGTGVGTLTVTDPDAGEAHTFSVPATVPFEVVGGTLKTTEVLDFRDRATWSFDLVVTDKDGLTFTKLLTITVTEVVLDPLAGDDTVNGLVGNTRTAPSASVLANDDDPERGTLTVTAGALPTTRGGTVAMAVDGTFRYDPPVGVKDVTDTVDYEITSSVSGRTDTGTLSLVITNRLVWYVDAAVTATGNGTSHSPFKTVALLGQGVSSDKDKVGDEIFLADGTYGPMTLKADQRLYGAQAGLPGLVDAVPAALASVKTTDTRAALALATGTTVDGVLLHSVGSGLMGPALSATSVGSATVTEKSRIYGQTGPAVRIVSGSGVIAVAASVEGRTSDVVRVDGRSGTVAFTGLVESRGTNPAQRGVLMTNSTGTVSFSGGLQLHTTGAAFSASGGGTVTVTGANNWVKSNGNAAVSINGTAIGSDGIRLKRVDVGSGTGIVLRDTGIGRLVVTGDGSGSMSQVGSVLLSNTNGADLTAVNVSPRSDAGASVSVDGLRGRVRLTDSTVTASTDNGMLVNGSTGEVVLERTTVGGSADSGVVVVSSTGTSMVTVTDSTISGSGSTGAARDGLRVESSGTASIVTTVTGSTFADNRGDQIQVVARGSGNSSTTITGNSVSSTGQGIVVNVGGSGFTGRLAYDVRTNNIPRSGGVGIAVSSNGTGSGTVEGYVQSNVIGGQCATGILVDAEGTPVVVASVKGNQLTGCSDPVVARGAQDGSQLHLTLEGNTTSGITGNLRVRFGAAGSTGVTCLAPSTSPGTVTALDIDGGNVGLPGYAGALSQSGVTSWFDNRASPGTSLVTVASGSHPVSNLPCLTPTF